MGFYSGALGQHPTFLAHLFAKNSKKKEQQWVKDNNIEPPFPVGAKVRLLSHHYSETIGVINQIYKYEPADTVY